MIKEFLLEYLGLYKMQFSMDPSGVEYISDGIASLDIPWICSAILLFIVVLSTFKIIGLILSSGFKWSR